MNSIRLYVCADWLFSVSVSFHVFRATAIVGYNNYRSPPLDDECKRTKERTQRKLGEREDDTYSNEKRLTDQSSKTFPMSQRRPIVPCQLVPVRYDSICPRDRKETSSPKHACTHRQGDSHSCIPAIRFALTPMTISLDDTRSRPGSLVPALYALAVLLDDAHIHTFLQGRFCCATSSECLPRCIDRLAYLTLPSFQSGLRKKIMILKQPFTFPFMMTTTI